MGGKDDWPQHGIVRWENHELVPTHLLPSSQENIYLVKISVLIERTVAWIVRERYLFSASVYGAVLSMQTFGGLSICCYWYMVYESLKRLKIAQTPLLPFTVSFLCLFHSSFRFLPITGLPRPNASWKALSPGPILQMLQLLLWCSILSPPQIALVWFFPTTKGLCVCAPKRV